MLNQFPPPYAPVLIKLLKDVIYYHDPHWDKLLNYFGEIRDYFAKMGVEVHLYETEGFAYLTQPKEIEIDGKKETLPRLTMSRGLDPKTTIFCVLLRMELQKFDADSTETGRLIISLEKITDLLEPYLGKSNDEEKLRIEINRLINKVNDLGILKIINDDKYEVLPIIKAKINVELLEELKEKLEKYATISVS